MSLANLSIVINANTGAAQADLRGFGQTARASMDSSREAVDAYQAQVARSAQQVSQASRQMGASVRAANDEIVTSSQRSEEALKNLNDTAQSIDTRGVGERIGAAIGDGIGRGIVAGQLAVETYKDALLAKAKVIAIGLAVAAVGGVAAVMYGAYRIIDGTLGFITGLFNGESYKSSNIDSLIATNNQVKELQEGLRLSAQEAAALSSALALSGTNKADYSAAYKSAETAMRTNGDELDRLGVKYKNSNGQLLTQRQFLENVKTALDEYKEGWDRNSAAAAMGAGTYAQVSAALKVNEDQLQASKQRLDDYGLGFGADRQAAITAYEKAVREFGHEADLTSRGFAAAIADNIMPALTTLAEFFKDGFPFAVNAFRYSLATVTSMLYGIKMVFDIVAEAAWAATGVIGEGLTGLANASVKVLTGDFAGARQALVDGWHAAGKQVTTSIDVVMAAAQKNRSAMLLAWGLDDRTQSLAEARAGRAANGAGKAYVPPPKPAANGSTSAASAFESYLLQLDQQIKKVNESEYASMRLKAAQLAEKEGITDLSGAMERINAIQKSDSEKVVGEALRKSGEQVKAYRQQTDAMLLGTLAREQFNAANAAWLQTENEIAAAQKSGKPLTDDAVTALRAQTAAAEDLLAVEIRRRYEQSRSSETGVNKALKDYQESATDAAKNAESFITGSFKRAEDAILNWAKTGKLSFKDVFSFMAEEFLRQQTRMLLSKMFDGGVGGAGGGGGFSILGVLKSVGSFFTGGTPVPLASGTNYVPYDGFAATLHKGEAVVPAVYNNASMGGGKTKQGNTFDFSGQTINVGQGVSRAEVQSALAKNNTAVEMHWRRLSAQGAV